MPSVEELLRRWHEAGVLDEAAAERIRAFECEVRAPGGRDEGPGVVEALIYLGIAVIAVGVIILVSTSWDELEDWARVAVVGVPGLLAVALGQGLRSLRTPGMVRGGHMAWLAGTALVAGSVAVLGANADWDGADAALAAGAVGMALALVLWVLAPSHPQVLGIGGGMVVLAMALGGRSDEFSFIVAGGTLAIFGGVGIALAEPGLLQPLVSVRAMAGLGLAFGSFFAGFDGGWEESLAFVGGMALVGLSVWRGAFLYIIFGVAAGFAGLIATITRHAGDPATASMELILIGAMLLATVALLARFRPWVREAAP